MSGGTGNRWIGAAAGIVAIIAAPAAQGTAPPSAQDIEAISHTLGFIDNIPRAGKLRIGILCKPGDETAEDVKRVADAVSGTPGPGATTLVPVPVAADRIRSGGDLDALLLMPGTEGFAHDIIAEAARRHLVTVATDADCLVRQICVLWVQSEPHVAVTLDTALAETLSVRVSPIFAMMVKRK